MYGIVLSALFSALGYLVKSFLVKFVVFFALFFVVAGFIQVLQSSGLLPTASSLNGVFGGIPAGVWYFLDLFNFSFGFPVIVSAYVSRFIIRRIPVIG